MRQILFALLLLVLPSAQARRPAGEYRIMSCNIRITGLPDDAP